MSELNHSSKVHRNMPGIFWPLTLITVGVLFLLSNLGVTKLDLWDLLATYWPLIFVIGSLDDIIRGKEIPGSIIAIGLGGLMVAGNLGYFPLDAWQIIFRFWPVLIVSIGLNLLFANQSILLNVVGAGLAILVVAGLVFLGMGQIQTPAQASSPVEVDLQKATTGQLSLEVPIGPLHVAGGAGTDKFVSGTYSLLQNEQLEQDYTVSNGRGTLSLSTRGNGVLRFPRLSGPPRWDIKLNDNIPMALKLQLAVGDTEVDLTGTKVNELDINNAVGMLDLTLDANQSLNAVLNLPVGRAVIRVPQGTPVIIRGGFAVTIVTMPDGWVRSEGLITSPGGGPSTPIIIEINQPVGLLKIVYTQ